VAERMGGGHDWRVYCRATGYFVGRGAPKRGNSIFPNVTPNNRASSDYRFTQTRNR